MAAKQGGPDRVRVYVPLAIADLDDLAVRGELGPAPLLVHAVTDDVRRRLPRGDEEEREYAALWDAVETASRRRAVPGDRRVVAAADVAAGALRPAGGSRVELAGPVPAGRVVSFHVEEVGGGDADLLWYDVTELDELRRFARGR